MIPKSGYRFSEKIMLKQNALANRVRAPGSPGRSRRRKGAGSTSAGVTVFDRNPTLRMISPAVSSLADAALLLPASVLVLLALAALREGRLALAFAVSLGAAAVTTLVLKLIFHACGHTIADSRVVSPSGHVAFSATFYGALAVMLSSGRERRTRLALGIGAALLLIAVGISRVRMGAHSTAEVLIGYMVGAAAVGFFHVLHGWARRPVLPWLPFAAGMTLAVVVLGGAHFSLEPKIARLARQMASSLDVCAPSSHNLGGKRFSSDRH